jgi:hypothetical protein
MRFPEIVRMSDTSSPVWAKKANKGGGGMGGLITGLMFLLALFGVLIIVLAGMHGWSFGQAGGVVDGWLGGITHHAAAAAPAK